MTQSFISVGDFFDTISADYDQSIFRAVPPYRQMIEALLGYIFKETQQPISILELGCGTGNLSLLAAQVFPNAQLTLVDLSAEMLAMAENKLKSTVKQPIQLVHQGFSELNFEANQFDLVISSLALHHLKDYEKEVLYPQIYQWLKPGGNFRCADQCLALPEDTAHQKNISRWIDWAQKNGASQEEIDLWVTHSSNYDHYAPLFAHLQWLDKAGFESVDCYWRTLFWTVYGGNKPDAF